MSSATRASQWTKRSMRVRPNPDPRAHVPKLLTSAPTRGAMGDRNCVARAARDRLRGETEKALSMGMSRLRGTLLQQRFGAGEVCEVVRLGGRLCGVEQGWLASCRAQRRPVPARRTGSDFARLSRHWNHCRRVRGRPAPRTEGMGSSSSRSTPCTATCCMSSFRRSPMIGATIVAAAWNPAGPR